MDTAILSGSFQEGLRQGKRYQFAALTAVVATLALNLRWPWAGAGLKDPPIEIPAEDSIAVKGLPVPVSVRIAFLLLFLTYVAASLLAAFAIRSARRSGERLMEANPGRFEAALTHPSLATEPSRALRLSAPVVVLLLVLVVLMRESWWEGASFGAGLGQSLLLLVLLFGTPQYPLIAALWEPWTANQEPRAEASDAGPRDETPLAAAGAALLGLLREKSGIPPERIRLDSPAAVADGEADLSVFLYSVSPNPIHRNAPDPGERNLPLELHYLITAHRGKSDPESAHAREHDDLGRAMAALLDPPADAPVRILPVVDQLEQITRIWSLFPGRPYSPSFCCTVTVMRTTNAGDAT